jgi:thiamine biosynthesis protein ThiS
VNVNYKLCTGCFEGYDLRPARRGFPAKGVPLYRGEMRIVVNGQEREAEASLTLAALLEQLGSRPDRVAVELNRAIVPRERWPQTQLQEGDRLEIVHFVGGGAPLRRCN